MSQTVILAVTAVAIGAVSERRFVGFDGAQITVAGANVLGVADYGAVEKEAYAVNVIGTSRVEAGGPVAVGDRIKSDAQARAVVQGGAGATVGFALTSAVAAGEDITILLSRQI